jgi:capsule polysaccharide export protein KpsE/RkpR
MLRCPGFERNTQIPLSGDDRVTDLRVEPTATSMIRLSDFVLPLWTRRRAIVICVAAAAVIAVAAALLWPKSYRATTTLLPPERRMDNPVFAPGAMEGLGASLRGITLRHVATPTDVFVAILESRSVRETLVERFGLREDYRTKSLERAGKRLAKDTAVQTTQDGMITVAAVARSAEKAAAIANGYVEELDRVNRTIATQEAAAIRAFVEKELAEAHVRLAACEDTLLVFQEKHGAIEVGEQARAVIMAASQIRARILNEEVQLGVLRRTRDDSHPEVVDQMALISELRARLSEIEGPARTSGAVVERADSASTTAAESRSRDVFPPLSSVPELGFQYARLLREVKTEEAVVTLLTEQVHWARIEEKRSLPTVRVLDRAVPPERRWRPRRTLFVAATVAAALALSIVASYALEVAQRIRRDPVRYASLHALARDVRRGLGT